MTRLALRVINDCFRVFYGPIMRESMKRWSVAIAAALMNSFQTGAFFFTPTTLMPTIVQDFGIPLSLSTLPIAFGKVIYVFLLVPGGMLVDYVGPRLTVLVGIATLAATMTLYASFVSSFALLLLVHFVMASSAAISGVPIYSIFVAQWFTPANIGLAMGLVLAGYSAAGTLFPVFLGALCDIYGWRAAMTSVVLVLWFVALPIAYFALHENVDEEDYEDNVNDNTQSLSNQPTHELVPLADHKSWTFVGFAFSYMLLQYCNGCFIENIMFFLTIDKKLSLGFASIFFSSLNLAAFSAKLIGGHLGDRFDRFFVASAASAISSIGIGFLFIGSSGFDEDYIPTLTTYSFPILVFSVLYGFGYGACFNSLYALVPIVFGKKDLGRTQSALFGIGLAGNAVGSVLTSVLRSKFGSYQRPFLVALVACIANFFTFNATRISLGGSIEGLKALDAEHRALSDVFLGVDELDEAEEAARHRIGGESESGTPRMSPFGSYPHLNPYGAYNSSDALTSGTFQYSGNRLQATPRTLSFLNADTPEASSPYFGDSIFESLNDRTFEANRTSRYPETGMVPDRGYPIPRDWSNSSLRRNVPSMTDLSASILPPPAASSSAIPASNMGVRKSSTIDKMLDSGIFSASLESVGYLGTKIGVPARAGGTSAIQIPQARSVGRGQSTQNFHEGRQNYGATPSSGNFNNG